GIPRTPPGGGPPPAGPFPSPPSSRRSSALATVLHGLTLRGRALRVLRLPPVVRTAGAIARARPLRHDALEAHGAGLREQRGAVAGVGVVEHQTERRGLERRLQLAPALVGRQAAAILAV